MIIKKENITDTVRVIIDDSLGGYVISTEQYVGDCGYPWEVGRDGWRLCTAEYRKSLKAAEKVFAGRIESEKRYH